jgi:hypothetical protein
VCLPLILGIEDSYSDYHQLKPILFPLLTIGVSLGLWLHRSIEWKIPAFLLIIIASFSVTNYPTIHNISAILFFMSSTWIMLFDKRFKIFGIISAILYPTLFIDTEQNLFLFEVLQIPILSFYHFSRVVYLMRLKNKI